MKHDNILKDLLTNTGTPITTDPSIWNLSTPGYKEILDLWKAANFNLETIKWINYYPTKDFPQEIVDSFAKKLNLSTVHRSWISRIDPGYMAPWHWDIDDNEEEYLKQGPITRYTIFLKDTAPGQIFILEKEYL